VPTKKKKILFIIPPYSTSAALFTRLFPMPFAAVSLAAILRDTGKYEVTIKDFLVPWQQHPEMRPFSFEGKNLPPFRRYGQTNEMITHWFAENIQEFDAVGLCTCQCNIIDSIRYISVLVKGYGKPLVIGGPAASTLTDKMLKITCADVCVVGEGELVVDEAFTKALGIKQKSIRLTENPVVIHGKCVTELDKLPLPAWDLARPENYPKSDGKLRGILAVSRGCPWACKFCSVHTIMGRNHRRMKQKRIAEHLLHLARFGVKFFTFIDDNLFINKKAVDDVMGAIDKAEKVMPKHFKASKFYSEEGMEVRVAAEEGIIERVSKRFVYIALGLESINSKRIKAMQKPFNLGHFKRALTNFRRAKVTPRVFYLIGLPGDTAKSVAEDIVRLGRLCVDVRQNNVQILPGTQLHKQYLEEGIINKTYDWRLSASYTVPYPKSGLTSKLIRQFRSILGAIGTAASELDIAITKDSLEEIVSKLEKKYFVQYFVLEHNGYLDSMYVSGNMFNSSSLKHILEIIMIRFSPPEYKGAKVKLVKKENKMFVESIMYPSTAAQEYISEVLKRERHY